MAQYDRQIATAIRLIAKYGQAVTWRSANETENALEPWKATAGTPTDTEVSICFVPAKDNEWRKLFYYLKGTEVPAGKLAGLMGQVSFTPSLKDVVIRDGKTLRIANIDLLSPNGQKILYTLEFDE